MAIDSRWSEPAMYLLLDGCRGKPWRAHRYVYPIEDFLDGSLGGGG